jgi:acid stress-induced BolA-like protein IbaG/YrbA
VNSQTLYKILANAIPNADLKIDGGEGKYSVSVVGQVFEGLTLVKRQQFIYQFLNDYINSGEIHAVTMQLKTPSEKLVSEST